MLLKSPTHTTTSDNITPPTVVIQRLPVAEVVVARD